LCSEPPGKMTNTNNNNAFLLLLSLLLAIESAFSSKITVSEGAVKPRPVVLWHGMGDTCCYSFSMGAIKDALQQAFPGIYVYSIMIGGSIEMDEVEGFLGNVNDQVEFVCQQVKQDPNLQGGFNAVGFSQGGEFMRAYVERCNDPPVYNLITLGGQHMGVADIPDCTTPNETICETVEYLLEFGAYMYYVQESVVQAQYFHDPLEPANYLADNIFLPDINNELTTKNPTYKANMVSLNNFVMYKFTEDTVVVPKDSSWFAFYADNSLSTIIPLQQQPTYTEDWIGLKTLDEAGKLHFETSPFEHMHFTIDWFVANVMNPWLNNTVSV